ncbi:alpha/beta-hydrolase [Saccharata proteae CBS 121410]|uniref:Alpha/beta-hydrolase n=1 Tax=Saccharata proteae CBS 121410 TaxID=1314787 RepID=A0A9P4LXA3_9PEZI|nr:alpha/beta-hydrolase [Saccharata proteae CBS 121410]
MVFFDKVVQYAASAYCFINENKSAGGSKVGCYTGNCPLVEVADTNTTAEFQNTIPYDSTGFVAVDSTNELIVVSFRGSVSIANWIADFTFETVDSDLCDNCTVHKGFWESWTEVSDVVMSAVAAAAAANPSYGIVSVGHSLGAAVAAICAAELRNAGYTVAMYTFGSPRLAPPALSSYISNQPGGNYRVTHYNDPVPRLPTLDMGFVHISPEYYIATPNLVTVTSDAIQVYEGDSELLGNAKWGLDVDIAAHLWYFNNVGACYAFDISLRF